MARSFTVQMSEEEYRIVASTGEESNLESYAGPPVAIEIDGDIYYCHIADPDDETPEVYRVASVDKMPSTVDEVEFEDDSEEEDAGPVLVDESGV